MRIKTLTLKDYRRFENLHIEFNLDGENNGGLTVLVAKNGEGKTSILDAVNVAWGTFIGAMPNAVGGGLKESDRRTTFIDGEIEPQGEPEIEASFVVKAFDSLLSVKRSLSPSKKRVVTTTKDAKSLSNYARQILRAPSSQTNWPIIAYYGDNRLWAGGRLTTQKVSKTLAMGREYGYADATNPKSGYKEFSLWFPALEFAIFIEEQRHSSKAPGFNEARLRRYRSQLELIKSALQKSLEPAGRYDVVSDYVHGIWAIDSEHNSKIPIDSLSAGAKIIIGLVGDVAFRCVRLNPHLGDEALSETPGIVLIDEIELHLHPAWQQRILPILRSIFPRIQFIVTTHSPQVVTSVAKECVRIVSDGRVENAFFETQGVESQVALLEVFGVDPAPREDPYVSQLFEYENIVQKGQANSEMGRKLYGSLVDHFGRNYPPLERIEISRKFAKKQIERSEDDNALL